MSKKAVFLDRDGTIIPETGALTADTDVEPLREAVAAVKALRDAGFLAVVVTNQSGVARGYYTEAELAEAHTALIEKFEAAGAPLDGIYYCPHLPDGSVEKYAVDCDCRKPKPGLLLKAAHHSDIDLSASYMVGDTERDIEAGVAAGCKGTALIMPDTQDAFEIDFSGQPRWKEMMDRLSEGVETGADAVVPDVRAAAEWILEMEADGDG